MGGRVREDGARKRRSKLKMTVGGIGGVNAPQPSMGAGQAGDAYGKNLQRQIEDAQKRLKELSSDDRLSPEEKMEKRREISQEIADLNQQLRQHQTEVRRQAAAAKQKENAGQEKQGENNRKAKGKSDTGMSSAKMQAVISADASVKQAEVQGNVNNRLEGRAGVLKAQIKQDGNLGMNTELKKAELAEVESRSGSVLNAQGNTLADANHKLSEGAKETPAEEGANEGSSPAQVRKGQEASDVDKNGQTSEDDSSNEAGNEERIEAGSRQDGDREKTLLQGYYPIDIRL